MSERQRKLLSAFGAVIFILGIGLGIWAVASRQGAVSIGSRAWSADGQRLVFVWNNRLYTVDISGTHLQQLTTMNGQYREPAWSPQGDSIVYMFRQSQSSKYGLWFIDSTGQNAKRAMPEEALDEYYPHWSPDGKWLGFYRTQVYDGSPSEYGYGYFVITDFNKVYRQPAELSLTDDMARSPDSKEVTFMGFSGSSWNIYSLATDGTTLQQLTDSRYDRSPAWSPDGHQLAFYSERETQQNWRGSIYIQDLPSRNIRRVTGIPNRTDRIAWSPDGRKIALATYSDTLSQADLCLMNADGTNIQLVSLNIQGLFSWSPNGQFLTFVASDFLVVLDTNTDNIVLRYHPRLLEPALSFLPISSAESMALVSLLVGPLFMVPLTAVHLARIRHPMLRYLRAALQAYAVFLGYALSFAALAACLAILFFALAGVRK